MATHPSIRTMAGVAALAARLAAGTAHPPRRLDPGQRLAMLPRAGAPVWRPVELRWDEHAVPHS